MTEKGNKNNNNYDDENRSNWRNHFGTFTTTTTSTITIYFSSSSDFFYILFPPLSFSGCLLVFPTINPILTVFYDVRRTARNARAGQDIRYYNKRPFMWKQNTTDLRHRKVEETHREIFVWLTFYGRIERKTFFLLKHTFCLNDCSMRGGSRKEGQ